MTQVIISSSVLQVTESLLDDLVFFSMAFQPEPGEQCRDYRRGSLDRRAMNS